MLLLLAANLAWTVPAGEAAPAISKSRPKTGESTGAVLWREPDDIASRDLFYGPGGKKHAPTSTVYSFVKEDLDASNPKFDVTDPDGTKWKIKLGQEVKPETAATRLVWAVGYFADEDYFLPQVKVEGLPRRVHRGSQYISANIMQSVRLKRHVSGKKEGDWKWNDNPFQDTREMNGLRVMMALINNWDLKNENNDVIDERDGRREYRVHDLGASFGTAGFALSQAKAKGNLRWYAHSQFLTKVTPDYVNFKTPGRPSLLRIFALPAFARRIRMEEIGKRIPRNDARWMGDWLGRLSHQQISDAFRAAGYSPQEVDGFAAVVERRIGELRKL